MRRRSFFKWLATAAATVVGSQDLDLDRLLWVPGEKTFFLPPEKPIVHGADAVRVYEQQVVPSIYKDGRREIHTAMGWVVVDAKENVLSIGGRPVSAVEAARARLTMFNRRNPIRGNMVETVSQIISDRVAAGWPLSTASGKEEADFFAKHRLVEGVINVGQPGNAGDYRDRYRSFADFWSEPLTKARKIAW